MGLRFTRESPRIARALLALALVSTAACRSESPRVGRGAAHLVVTGSGLTADVTRIVTTITPGDGPDFAPIVQPLTKAPTGWSAYLTGIPAGPGRQFEVVAYDGSDAPLYRGRAKTNIVAGAIAIVVIQLSKVGPPFDDGAPVIDSISASHTTVVPGGQVSVSASAHDPDAADTISYRWAATCGTFDDAGVAATTWHAPAAEGTCQLSITVTDSRSLSVTGYLVVEARAGSTGDVLITVDASTNTAPVIAGIQGDLRYGATIEGDLAVTATDPDGDALSYAWASTCAGSSFDTAPPHGPATPRFTSTTTTECAITVAVSDPPDRGGYNTGVVRISTRPVQNYAPAITQTVQPNVDLSDPTDPRKPALIGPGEAAVLGVNAIDPEGQPLTFAWAASAGTLDGQVDRTASPSGSVIVFHAPAPMPAEVRVTVTVRDPAREEASHVFTLKPRPAAGPCAGQPDGTACDDANACTAGETCRGGACTGGTATVCPGAAACQVSACNPGTGQCSSVPVADGTACDDGNACTTPDVCAAGACLGPTKSCAPADACHLTGTCNATSGACSTPAAPAGTTCDDTNACTQTDACDGAGACVGSSPLVCSPGTCDPATGTCPPPPTSAQAPRPQLAKWLQVQFKGLTMGQDGAVYQAGKIFTPTKTFDGIDVTSAGAGDLFLAKYDAAGAIRWARAFGDAAEQETVGAGATGGGTVAVVGFFTGTLAPASLGTPSPTPVDYLLLLDGATGNQKAGGAVFNNGIAGRIATVAANPNLNLIAVCGYASVAATDLVPGATFGGGTEDIVVALLDSSGRRIWSRQIGAGGAERCDALTIDDAGDVHAAGRYDGALDLGRGALPNPASSFRSWIWVAKLNGLSGATLSNASFGAGAGRHTPKGLAVDAAGDLFIAGVMSNTLNFTADPANLLTTAGGTDAFIAKLDAAYSHHWSARMGASGPDELRGLALDSSGNPTVVGLFNTPLGTPTTGFAALTAAATSASDAFVVTLDGTTGASVTGGASAYGDFNSQSANVVSVNRTGVGSLKDLTAFGGAFTGTIDFGPPTAAISTLGTATDTYLVFARP